MRRLHGAFRLLAEIGVGLAVLAALGLCLLGWRLAQGPLDVTWLVQRERARFSVPGTALRIGGASLAWEGFGARDQPLDIRLSDVSVVLAGDGPQLHLGAAHVGLAVGPLLLGRIVPRAISVDGADIRLVRRADGALALPKGGASSGTTPIWPPELRHLRLSGATITLHDVSSGLDVRAAQARIDLNRGPDGFAGSAHAMLDAGGVSATLDADARPQGGGAALRASLTPVNPAALSHVPGLRALAALDAPVALTASATLGPDAAPSAGRLDIAVGPGILAAGQGSVRLAQATATLSATPSVLHLEAMRVALAPLQGAEAPPPTITGAGSVARASGRLHADFAVNVDAVAMGDLGQYWPAGTGGGTRPWLVRNVTAGRARDAHVAGTLDAPDDLSDITVSTLSGGLAIDDATVWWLRPVPPLTHVGGRLVIEGPDALRVTMERGGQDRLRLAPGSFIRVTGLEEHDQFADIDAGLSGPLADALALLNHPRLKLLSRGNVDVVDPAGAVQAKLTLHIPLEDRVTMDDIPVSASATLTGVHLGRIVGGRDLDRAALALKVTGDGLDIAGDGAVAGIPARLALKMDFRAGPPDQVLQHLTADGTASSAQLVAAGAPANVAAVLTGGVAGLRVDYAGRRNGSAALQVDADLAQAALTTPVGWSKVVGQKAQAGAHVLLDHGRLAGVDDLHAEGPGLSVVSRAVLAAGRPRALVLDRLQLGRTRAAGRIDFPSGPRDPSALRLTGPVLDLSGYLDVPASKPAPARPEDDAPGPPWSVRLAFGQVLLAHGKILAPLRVDVASDGLKILRADAQAGAPGDLSVRIVPAGRGRHLAVQADDAGAALNALGVADNLLGGTLVLDGDFDDSRLGSPLTGTATLDEFQVTQAPFIGRLLQGVTLYGLVDALRGPGLRFSKLVAPFRWHRRVLHLSAARAFSPSLGLTAEGDIDLHRHAADVNGTVVPAYFFNQLLGNLPVVGRIFSPEKGGGVFAARYSVRGPLADPKVGVNPLAVLTPGFLREGFGLFAPKPAKTP